MGLYTRAPNGSFRIRTHKFKKELKVDNSVFWSTMIRTLEAVYSGISNVPVTGIILGTSFLAFVLCRLVHRLVVGPLSKIPGPLSLKATSIFNKYYELRGHKREWLHELHNRYGEVVTIAPNEVSFASETGLKKIYSSGSKDYLKTELYNLFKQDGQMYSRPEQPP